MIHLLQNSSVEPCLDPARLSKGLGHLSIFGKRVKQLFSTNSEVQSLYVCFFLCVCGCVYMCVCVCVCVHVVCGVCVCVCVSQLCAVVHSVLYLQFVLEVPVHVDKRERCHSGPGVSAGVNWYVFYYCICHLTCYLKPHLDASKAIQSAT